jgi:hypothetical protein
MRRMLILLALAASVLAAGPVFAARPAVLDRQAKKACLSGDYVKGVGILAELYVDTGDATYLYNQGRCYEQNVRYVEAAERFREYLRKAPKLGAKVREEVEQHIADCEAALAKRQPSAPPPPAPPPTPPLAPPPAQIVAQAPAPAPEIRPWQRTAKWVATGAAVAFLGLGVAGHAIYYGKNSDYNDDPTCGGAEDTGRCKSLADSADTAQIVAIAGYSAAAVAAGLAVTFWLTDKPSAQAPQPTGVAVSCAPALAGLACAGRF